MGHEGSCSTQSRTAEQLFMMGHLLAMASALLVAFVCKTYILLIHAVTWRYDDSDYVRSAGKAVMLDDSCGTVYMCSVCMSMCGPLQPKYVHGVVLWDLAIQPACRTKISCPVSACCISACCFSRCPVLSQPMNSPSACTVGLCQLSHACTRLSCSPPWSNSNNRLLDPKCDLAPWHCAQLF